MRLIHFSDAELAFLICWAVPVSHLPLPQAVIFQGVGPIKPMFDAPADKYPEGSIGAEVAVEVAAGMMTLAKFGGFAIK